MPSLVTQSQWQSVAQKDLSIVFLDHSRDFPSMLGLLYRFKKAEQGTEYMLETSDLGLVPPMTSGEITYGTIQEGYKKSVSETEYAYGIKVTRRALRNDLYGAVRDTVANMSVAFKHLREVRGAFPFNNAFNTSFTVGDGLQLCSSAHTSKVGGSNQSNYSTAAFSAANVQANRILMKKLKTNTDNPMVNVPDLMIIPMDYEDKAYEIIKSMGKVDTSTNNRNYHQGRYDVIVWDNYLTSSSRWFLANSKRMRQRLMFYEWEPVQFFRSGEFDTLVSKHAGYCSFEVATVFWDWIFGSNA